MLLFIGISTLHGVEPDEVAELIRMLSGTPDPQTNDLQNLCLLLPSLADGICTMGQGLIFLNIRIMWLSGILGYGADGQVFQWESAIKSPSLPLPCSASLR